MNSFKLRLIFIIIAVIYLLSVTAVFAADDAGNTVTDKIVPAEQRTGVENLKMKIYKFEGREMIQLRSLADEFAWDLQYDSLSKGIIIKNQEKSITLSAVNDPHFNIQTDNDGDHSKDIRDMEQGKGANRVYPIIKDGRTYLPVEVLRNIFNEFEEGRLLTGLYIDKTGNISNGKIIAHIRLYNLSQESVKLNFGSGQRYDLFIQEDGQEIWRWSDGRFFTMALAQIEVEPGESLEYDVELPADLATGEYTLSGELATVPGAVKLNKVNMEVKGS